MSRVPRPKIATSRANEWPTSAAHSVDLKDIVINHATDRTSPGLKPQRDVVPEGQSEFGRPSVEQYLAATVSPDLAAPSGPIEPQFPVPAMGTQVVLYDGASDQLRLHWTLAIDDLLQAASSFPASGGSPVPTLRLCRMLDDGGREVVAERSLRAARLGGQGETAFRAGSDYACFSVDFGLRNEDGGWLVLTRSNQLQRAGSVGLHFPIDPALLVRRSRRAGSRHEPHRPGEMAADRAPTVRQRGSASPLVAEEAWGGGHPQDLSGGIANGEPFDSTLRNSLAEGQSGSERDAGIATGAPTQIPTLVYGCRTPLGTELLVEAELHIHGCATPNMEIELFGHRYRVGAGGRFRLTIKVDDPELLKRAFALHPPPESVLMRDD